MVVVGVGVAASPTVVVTGHYIIFICLMILCVCEYARTQYGHESYTFVCKRVSPSQWCIFKPNHLLSIFNSCRCSHARALAHPQHQTTFIQSDYYYFLRTIFRVLIFHLSALLYENSVIVILPRAPFFAVAFPIHFARCWRWHTISLCHKMQFIL